MLRSVRTSVRLSVPFFDSLSFAIPGDMRVSPFHTHSIGVSMVGNARKRIDTTCILCTFAR